jgi:hypothetical protein
MKKIKIKKKTLCDYLIEIVSKYRLLKETHVKEIMLKALRDYFNNQLSLNGLETIASLLNCEDSTGRARGFFTTDYKFS